MDFGGCDILKLAELLKIPDEKNESDSDDDSKKKKKPYEKITTASSAALAENKSTKKPPAADLNSKPPPEKPSTLTERPTKIRLDDGKEAYDPLDYDAFDKWIKKEEEKELAKLKVDTRKAPEYEIIYKQFVGTEDAFLQMGNKTALSSSCESIVIRIKLPKTNYKDMKLDVQKQNIELEANDYHLNLPLPHAIHPQQGNAAWDEDTETLTVTLFLDREYDFINF